MHAGDIDAAATISAASAFTSPLVSRAKLPPGLLAPRTVKDLVVGSLIRFEDRGTHQLKGVDYDWQLYAATDVGSTRT
jgi:class 3 adenylate cyclase